MSNQHLDITRDVCPMTLVRVRMKLEQLAPGELLEIRMAGGEPVASIPRVLKEEGHDVLEVTQEAGAFRVAVRKQCP